MKTRITLLIAAGILSFNSLFAEEGKVSFGLDVCPSVNWLNTKTTNIKSDGSSLKLNGALNINFNLGKSYAIVTGLRYNTFGGILTGKNLANTSETVKYEFNELEIPFGFKLRTGSIGDIRFAAHLGVGLGIDFKGKATIDDNAISTLRYENQAYDYKIQPFRTLYNLGIGAEYDLDATIITAKINYKGWFTGTYMYNNSINNPSKFLDLNTSNPTRTEYADKIIFQPSALELCIGVLF